MTSFTRRPVRRAAAAIAIAAVAGTTLLAGAVPATAATPEPTEPAGQSSFVLPVLPDTQFYSRYSASQFVPQYGTNPFEVQTQWIVDNQDELNMPFTVHVGDVVDQEWVGGEWDAAAKAMKILENGGMDYSILPGNHDVANQGARSFDGNANNYVARFGASQMQAQAGSALIGTYQNGQSSAYLFEAEGHTWMSLAIAWNASDDTFTWAQSILDANPGVPVILSSHAIINIAEDQVSPAYWWWGEELWNRLIKSNDEIILTVNGHFHGSTAQTRTNDAGNPVYQVLTDYQMAADGGNGIMSLFEFDLTNSKIDLETISPWVPQKHADSITSSDAPVYTGSGQSFSMPLDFGARFGWTLDAADEDNGDLSELAKEIVSEGWTGGDGGSTQAAAGSSADYIDVDGTIAHWRFGDVAEGIVDENTVIPDVAGASPMYRNPIDETDLIDELDDVKVTYENRPFYSSDFGAVCFEDVYRNASGPDNGSFLSTEYGAPATFANLDASEGYTIETFLQLDAEWTETANRWSAALTRGGARSWTGINDSSDPGAGVSWLGISNLREYQFSAADTRTRNSYTLWSGEIMQGAWHHVAIVNDPDANKVTMYVDGVPVLRNASSVGGMMAADFMPWIIGASTWDSEPEHGWNGCVGETRIVDHALATNQFLTERVDIDGTGANFSLATETGVVLEPTATVDELTGTGFVGAVVTAAVEGEPAGSAEVAADGTWTIELETPIAGSGAHAFALTQALGTRSGTAYEATITIGEDTSWAPIDGDLTDELEGRITVTPETFVAGQAVNVTLPEGYEGEEVYGFLFSDPTSLGVATVADGSVRLLTPSSIPLGVHSLALYTATGDVIGWSSVMVVAGATPGGGNGGSIPDNDGTTPLVPVLVENPAGAATDGSLAVTGMSLAGISVLLLAAVGAIVGGATLRARRTR